VNLEQLDQLLADWKKKVDLVGQNLIDLHGLPSYQRLAGVAGFPQAPLTGMTAARVTPALEAMNELFQHFDRLVMVVEKARELRKQVPRFLGSEAKVQEIESLLTGNSIQLPGVLIPLAQRDLLTAAETAQAIAPAQLLAAMIQAFQVARDAVLAVDEAWLRLEPKLDHAEAETLALQSLATSLRIDSCTELYTVRQKIASLRHNLDSDPLGVSADFEAEIQPLIAGVRTTLDRLVQQQKQIQAGFAVAHTLLQRLVELNHQAAAALSESQEKVVDHSTLKMPLAPSQIEAVSQWLTRLESKFAEASLLNPIGVGLENWTAKVKEYIATEEQAYAANQAPLELRRELRGRLDALKAKALARGLVEDSLLSELAAKAKQLLYTRPTPLDQASAWVSEYEKRLNSQLLR
jgi:hypothetical protein